jgi:hypothetical protein
MNGYNFTERVRTVLAKSREEADRLGHEYVSTEHILLGLVDEGEGVAASVLQAFELDPMDIRERIEAVLKRGTTHGKPDLPYTSRAKKVLELSMTEARELNHSYVGTEHLLLGLLREQKGIAAQVLGEFGVNIDAARELVLRLLGVDEPPPWSVSVPVRAARVPVRKEAPTEEFAAGIAVFGPALGPAYQTLRNELAWLYVKWDQYLALFGSTAERMDLLNDIAPLFFRIAEDTLWDDILASVARVSGPAAVASGSAVTLRSLPDLVDDSAVRAEITLLVADVIKQTEYAREPRNRRPTDDGLAVALERPARPIARPRRLMVANSLGSIAAVLNRLNLHYRKQTTTFDIGDYPNGALALVHALREGRDARRLRQQRIRDDERRRDDPEAPLPA